MRPLISKQLPLHSSTCARCSRALPTISAASIRTRARPSPLLTSRGKQNAEDLAERDFSQHDNSHPTKRRKVLPRDNVTAEGEIDKPNEDELGDFTLKNLTFKRGPIAKSLGQISENDINLIFDEIGRSTGKEPSTDLSQLGTEELEDEVLPGLHTYFRRHDDLKVHPGSVVPHQSRALLDRLNVTLAEAFSDPKNSETRRQLWRWYDRSKFNVPNFLGMIPRKAWDLIWYTHSVDTTDNPNRLVHLATIAQDMVAAGWILTTEQKIARIEGLFLNNKTAEALSLWEADKDELRRDYRFLDTGVHIYARIMSLERALEVLNDLLSLHSGDHSQTIVAVLSAFASSGQDDDLNQAWTLYHLLRQRKQTNITIHDYDNVTLAFLNLGYKNHALAVFRDMMLDQNVWTNVNNSRALERLAQLSQARPNLDHLKGLDPKNISFVPKSFQNRFFYASWLRKLIAERKLNEAAKVFDLMYEHGVKPDAHHLNGFINALFKINDESARQNAEEIGWAMIQTRLEFVRRRRLRMKGEDMKNRTIWDAPEGINIPQTGNRTVPPASIETFSLLVEHYLEKEMMIHVRHLRDLIPEASLKVNSFLMNHLLAAELRTRGFPYVWARFLLMSKNTAPDMLTYKMLWDCLKLHINSSRHRPVFDDIPSPRQLLKRMLADFLNLTQRRRLAALEDLDLLTYHDIIRCFFLALDVEGAFVAIQLAKHVFNLYPVRETITMVISQIAKLDDRFTQGNQLRTSAIKARHRRNQDDASSEFATIAANRVVLLKQTDRHWNDLDPLQKLEEGQRTLLSLLRSVVKKRQKSAGAVDFQNAINKACEDVEFGHIDVRTALESVPKRARVGQEEVS